MKYRVHNEKYMDSTHMDLKVSPPPFRLVEATQSAVVNPGLERTLSSRHANVYYILGFIFWLLLLVRGHYLLVRIPASKSQVWVTRR